MPQPNGRTKHLSPSLFRPIIKAPRSGDGAALLFSGLKEEPFFGTKKTSSSGSSIPGEQHCGKKERRRDCLSSLRLAVLFWPAFSRCPSTAVVWWASLCTYCSGDWRAAFYAVLRGLSVQGYRAAHAREKGKQSRSDQKRGGGRGRGSRPTVRSTGEFRSVIGAPLPHPPSIGVERDGERRRVIPKTKTRGKRRPITSTKKHSLSLPFHKEAAAAAAAGEPRRGFSLHVCNSARALRRGRHHRAPRRGCTVVGVCVSR